jgi:hypothetical protein
VRAGLIASFYCEAQGDPTPTIQWRKNGKRVSSTQSRYLVQDYPNGALLRIEPVRANRDDATYECVAENGVGDAVTAEAVLTVHDGKFLSFVKFKTILQQRNDVFRVGGQHVSFVLYGSIIAIHTANADSSNFSRMTLFERPYWN